MEVKYEELTKQDSRNINLIFQGGQSIRFDAFILRIVSLNIDMQRGLKMYLKTYQTSWNSSIQLLGKAVGLMVGLGILGTNLEEAKAQIFFDSPTATFGPGNTLAGYSATVISTRFGRFGPLPAGTAVTLQYQNGAGVNVGAPIPATIGPGGVLTVPPPPIPAGVAALGNQVVVTDTPTGDTTKAPLIWYNSAWIWGVTPAIKIDPIGLPGLNTQNWFIEDTGGADLIGSDSIFGSRSLSVVSSGFDLSYSLISGTLYEVIVDGDNSFIELSDQTYISFVNGSSFGTIDVGLGATTGSFDFSSIGLSGLWSYDSATNYTSATGTIFSPFDSPSISIKSVPEPSSLLTTVAALGLGLFIKAQSNRGTAVP